MTPPSQSDSLSQSNAAFAKREEAEERIQIMNQEKARSDNRNYYHTNNNEDFSNSNSSRKSGDSDRQDSYPPSRSSNNRLNVSDLLSSSEPSTKTNSFDSIKPEGNSSSKVSSPQQQSQSNESQTMIIGGTDDNKRPTTGNSTPAESGKGFISRQRSSSSVLMSAADNQGNSITRRPITPSGSAGGGTGGTSDFQAGEGVTAYHYAPVQQITDNRENIEYILNIREQPKHSRMCGVGEKADRRPIDPAPIIQLRVVTHENPRSIPLSSKDDPTESSSRSEPLRDAKSNVVNAQPIPNQTSFGAAKRGGIFRRGVPVKTEWGDGWEDKTWYLENPYYFMYAMLADAETDDELHLLSDGKTRYTTGSCVSCLYHLKDIDGSEQGFFVFPDLSIRVEGRYRLKLCLFETIGHEVHHCKSIYSKPFNVYTAKRFPGMEESTMLSKTFADQGLKVRVRKNPRARRARTGGKRKDAVGSEDDSEGEMYAGNDPRRSNVMGGGGKSDVMMGYGNDRGLPKRLKGTESGGYGAGMPVPVPHPTGPSRVAPTMYGMNAEPAMQQDKRPINSPHEGRLPPHPAYSYANEIQQVHPAAAAPSQSYSGQRRSSDVFQPPSATFSHHPSGPIQRGMPIDSPLDSRHPGHGPPQRGGPGHSGYPGDVEMGRDPYMHMMDRHPPPPHQQQQQQQREDLHKERYYDERDGSNYGHGYNNRRVDQGRPPFPTPSQSDQGMYNRDRLSANAPPYYDERDQHPLQRRLSGNSPSAMHHPSAPLSRPSEYGNPSYPPERGQYRYEDRDIRGGGGLGNGNGRMIMQHNDAGPPPMEGNRQRLPPLHVALSPETSPRESRTIVASPSGPRYSSDSGGNYGGPPPPPSGGPQRYPSYTQHPPPPPPQSNEGQGHYSSVNEHGHPRYPHGQQQQQQSGSQQGIGVGGRIPSNPQAGAGGGYQMPPPQPSHHHQYRRRS